MRTKLLILLASAGVLAAFAIPAGWNHLPSEADAAPAGAVVLEPGCCRGDIASLRIETGPETVVDRGTLGQLETGQELRGSFRYWQEPAGSALYVWDHTQTLVARVLNPDAVILVP